MEYAATQNAKLVITPKTIKTYIYDGAGNIAAFILGWSDGVTMFRIVLVFLIIMTPIIVSFRSYYSTLRGGTSDKAGAKKRILDTEVKRKILNDGFFFLKVLAVMFAVLIIIVLIVFPSSPSQKVMEEEIVEYRDELTIIIEYMKNSPHPRLYSHNSHEYGIISARGNHIAIEEKHVADTIDYLYSKSKYESITKDNNYVSFHRWASLGLACGIVYSMDGEKPENEIFTKIFAFEEENWYYYEHK